MKISLMFAAVLAVFFAVPARAFHPLTTEDTVFLGRDGRQVTGGVGYTSSEEGIDRYTAGASARLYYGMLDNWDVMVTVPWEGWSSRGITESGLGDVLLETKFQAGEAAGWLLALKPGFSLPAGSESKSIGAGKGGVWLYGLAGKTRKPWQFYLNAGFTLNRNSVGERINLVGASAAAALEVMPKILAAAELAAASSTDRDSLSHPITSGFSLVWSPYATLDVDAGIKLGLTRTAVSRALLAGITLRL